MAGGAADKNTNLKAAAGLQSGTVVYANAAVDLIMKARLPVLLILIPRNLDAIHAQIAGAHSGPGWMLRINLGQGYKGAPIPTPALNLGKLAQCGLMLKYRTLADLPGKGMRH